MKNVLIISPHFPPVNAADHHRVRIASPYLEENGWRPTVLAVAPEYVEAPQDDWLLKTLPADLEVHRTKAIPVQWTRWAGMSTLARRCYWQFQAAGDRLLKNGNFDLVYFSTTQMGVLSLGPRWLKRFNVPFAIDLQDPWVNSYYSRNPTIRPPGGKFKYALATYFAKNEEPRCVAAAAAVTAVSPMYVDELLFRYPNLERSKFTVLPFGATEQDFSIARQHPVSQDYVNPENGHENWVSVGRGGEDMEYALTGLFKAFRKSLDANPSRFQNVRLHFLGTSYAPGGRAKESVKPIAAREGVGEYVTERPHRIPYSEAMQCMVNADKLLIVGSNDASYNPSKVAPYLFSEKPLLAILHQDSVASDLLISAGVSVARFRNNLTDLVNSLVVTLNTRSQFSTTPLMTEVRNRVSAGNMTQRLTQLFDTVVG